MSACEVVGDAILEIAAGDIGMWQLGRKRVVETARQTQTRRGILVDGRRR